MNKDQLTEIAAKVIEDGCKLPGVTDVAVGGTMVSGLDVTVRKGETEKVEFNKAKTIEILVYKDKRKGSVSVTDLGPEALQTALQAAARIAEYTEPDEYAGLVDKKYLASTIPDLDLAHPAAIEAERAAEYAKECEDSAFAYDKRINNTEGASFATQEGFHIYANSNGFLGSYPTTRYSASCITIAEQAGVMQRDYDYTYVRDVHDLASMRDIGKQAASKTIARLGAEKINTCKAPILFDPANAKRLWSSMISAASGGNLYRERSFLLNAINTQILPDFVNITEQPHIAKAIGSAPFDAEGVGTYEKSIVDNGVLQTYLLGGYSARRLGLQTTGNAGGVHNFCVKAGKDDYAALIKKMHRGLIVTEMLGHGVNLVTGDFSQGAAGFWVEDGKIVHPVAEITIAGNIKDMLRGIIAVGSDLDWRGSVVTGSVLIDEMTIAGN